MSFKKKLLLNIGISLGIILILGAALFFLNSKIKDEVKQIQKVKEKLTLRSQTTEFIALLRRESEQVEPYLDDLDNMIITKDKLVNLSQDLSTIAMQNQVNLKLSIGKETPKTESELGEINITITIDGAFDNLIKFLKDLENSRYFVKLNKLDFTKKGNDFKGILNGVIFYF
ncbi:MAG: type 4a pilus biogenesis protein PilO [Candidatus Paceibacterota bacterium]